MAFPDQTYTDNESAAAALSNKASAAGLDLSGLNPIAQLQSAVANLLVSDPSTVTIPAGDVLSGTFGANKSGGADTGTYVFPSQVGFGTKVISTTALATPSALVATTGMLFASTVSGSSVMGFGTTNDVTLMNRAGTPVLGITANTSDTTLAGALAITTLFSSVTALATPSALAATALNAFASTVSGGVLMGFGTTNDVALKNRAGTTVLGIGPNTTTVNMVGAVTLTLNAATVINASVAGTSAKYFRIGSSGSDLYFGNEASVGGTFITGSGAYDAFVSSASGVPLTLATATTARLSISNAGAFDFKSNPVSGITTLAIGGAFTGATSMTYSTSIISTTALATPSALAATQWTGFASTVSGASIMGFGTTNDVALMNRAGTVVLGIGPNTTAVNMVGTLLVSGAVTFSSTLRVNGAASLGTAAGTDITIIDGTAFGAGVASLRFNGLSTAAVNNQVGTLTNAPVAGNATFWMPISHAGTIRYIPCW